MATGKILLKVKPDGSLYLRRSCGVKGFLPGILLCSICVACALYDQWQILTGAKRLFQTGDALLPLAALGSLAILALCLRAAFGRNELKADPASGRVAWRSTGLLRTKAGDAKLEEARLMVVETGNGSYSVFLAKGSELAFLVMNSPNLGEAKRCCDELSSLLWRNAATPAA